MFNFVKKFINDPKKQKPKWQDIKGDNFEKSAEQIKSEVVNVVVGATSFKGFLGDIKNMDEKELLASKKQDEQKKQEEMAKIRSQIKGRDVVGEMKDFDQKKIQEEDREKQMAEQRRVQLEKERKEREAMAAEAPNNSKKPGKEAKKRQFAKGPKKASTAQPTQEQLTQTGEFTQKAE